MGPFREEIKEMVDGGRADKGKKLSCAQTQEQLQQTYSNRFDIPSVHDIKSVVTGWLRVLHKNAVTEAQQKDNMAAVTRRDSSAYIEGRG